MKKQAHPGWYLTAWIVAAILTMGLLFSGCAYVDWQNYIAKSPAIEQATNKSPWTPTIQENYQLTDCQQTERRMRIAMGVHDKLIEFMDQKVTDPDQKQVITVEIRALYEYVDELHTWINDNCSEA